MADNDVDTDLGESERTSAAIKIQAGFKGYKTRRDLKAVRVCLHFASECMIPGSNF